MSEREFDFGASFGDARVAELKLLSWTHQNGKLELSPSLTLDRPWLDLIVSLIWHDLLTTFSYESGMRLCNSPVANDLGSSGIEGESRLEREMVRARVLAVQSVFQKSRVELSVTHGARVRLSELKQALRTGRERESFGILWDARHLEQDLQIAILECGETAPLAVAYLDMNGLKQINDTHGHDVGDLALRAYFQAVSAVLGEGGQAYRLSGGADEVILVLPNRDEKAGIQILRLACDKLMNERVSPEDRNALLSIAAGVITSTDPSASPGRLQRLADQAQQRAKRHSKDATPRPSVIAVHGKDELIIIDHDSGA